MPILVLEVQGAGCCRTQAAETPCIPVLHRPQKNAVSSKTSKGALARVKLLLVGQVALGLSKWLEIARVVGQSYSNAKLPWKGIVGRKCLGVESFLDTTIGGSDKNVRLMRQLYVPRPLATACEAWAAEVSHIKTRPSAQADFVLVVSQQGTPTTRGQKKHAHSWRLACESMQDCRLT